MIHSQYDGSGINTPWHAPVPCHVTFIFGDYQDLGLQAENGQFRVSVLRSSWPAAPSFSRGQAWPGLAVLGRNGWTTKHLYLSHVTVHYGTL